MKELYPPRFYVGVFIENQFNIKKFIDVTLIKQTIDDDNNMVDFCLHYMFYETLFS